MLAVKLPLNEPQKLIEDEELYQVVFKMWFAEQCCY